MTDTAPLEQLIDLLAKLARAPRANWYLYVAAIRTVRPIKIIVAGDCTMLLASAAITYARQMERASSINENELRGVAMSMSVILANELAAVGGPARPYYVGRD